MCLYILTKQKIIFTYMCLLILFVCSSSLQLAIDRNVSYWSLGSYIVLSIFFFVFFKLFLVMQSTELTYRHYKLKDLVRELRQFSKKIFYFYAGNYMQLYQNHSILEKEQLLSPPSSSQFYDIPLFLPPTMHLICHQTPLPPHAPNKTKAAINLFLSGHSLT